jgi:hypothetical protein
METAVKWKDQYIVKLNIRLGSSKQLCLVLLGSEGVLCIKCSVSYGTLSFLLTVSICTQFLTTEELYI